MDFPPKLLQSARGFSSKVPVDKFGNQQDYVDNLPLREPVKAALDRGLTVLQGHAFAIDLKAGIVVLRMDNRERMSEDSLEIVHSIIMVPKLLFECYPGDELWLFDPVQALRKPCIHVEGHRGVGQRTHRAFIEWHGMIDQALEVIITELHRRGPQNPLAFVFLKPEVKCLDDLRIDLYGPVFGHEADPDRGSRQPGEMILDRADITAIAVEAQPLDEGGQGGFNLDHRRACLERLTVQMRQNQSWFRAKRQSDIDKLECRWIDNPSRADFENGFALLLLPQSYVLARIPVWQSCLTKNRVVIGNSFRIVHHDIVTGIDQPRLDRRQSRIGKKQPRALRRSLF